MADQDIEKRVEDLYTLAHYCNFIQALDQLEGAGYVDILNDHERGVVGIKRNNIGGRGGLQI